MIRTALLLLALAPAALGADLADRLWVVRITTERSSSMGTSRRSLAAPALPVGPEGLLVAAGFSLEPPDPTDDAEAVEVVAIAPGGRAWPAHLLGGDAVLDCTFFRVLAPADALPEPVALPEAPVPAPPGTRVTLHGRHGELMRYAARRGEAVVDARTDKPLLLYALRDASPRWVGSVATTEDGAVLGFVDTRPTLEDGAMVGLGSETLVVVGAPAFREAARRPPEPGGPVRSRAWIGINLAPFDEAKELYFGIDGDLQGALVTGVQPGSPADRAGLRVHDLVQTLGTLAIRFETRSEWDALLRAVQRQPLGVALPCRVTRFTRRDDGTFAAERLELEITLAERPVGFDDAPETELDELGFKVKPLTDDWRQGARLSAGTTGVVVTRVARASPAQLAGLQPGDLILEVEREPVTDVDGFVAQVGRARAAGRSRIVFFVRRGVETLFVGVATDG